MVAEDDMKLSEHFYDQNAREVTPPDTKVTDFNSDVTKVKGSPRTVLEASALVTSSDTISISSRSSESSNEKINGSIERSQWKNLLNVWKSRSMSRLSTFRKFGNTGRKKDVNRKVADKIKNHADDAFASLFGEFTISKPSWRNFGYDELADATDNFSAERLIGKGGHAEVYRGCLANGQLVAIKKLTKGSTEEQRTADFLAELGIIAHIDHPNAARLIGFGVEGGLHMVLQFSPHGSLASRLHGSKAKLEWGVRYKVALGTAEGLRYLHEGCQRRIIHRDIKASNVLLTEDYQPQISDFGLAKWLPDRWTHHIVSPIEGTFGYLAPEYFMHGIVDEKIDVFAFGVLLLELVTGRCAVDSCRQSLLMWAKPLFDGKQVKDLVDPNLGEEFDPREMNWVMLAASLCTHHLPNQRPRMSEVVRLLKGDFTKGEEKMKPVSRLSNALDVDEYTPSRYLNDLNRHRQLALEF